jgi:XRE family transcriptional regulator, regulator of sulfur utilization
MHMRLYADVQHNAYWKGIIMDYLNENVAINLKKIRKGKKMSLDMLAAETGISKSMLGQIERGEANPTLGTLGKITSGLRVSFMELIGPPREEIYIMRKETLTPIKEEKDNFRNYAYFPFEEGRDFEIYCVELEPNGCYACGSHGENTIEYIVVFSGTLRLEIDGANYHLAPGDAIRLYSDKDHTYYGCAGERTQFYMLFTWE